MSQNEQISVEEIPRLEPWLIIALSGFVPMTAAFMVPDDHMVGLLTAGLALITGATVMLVRRNRRRP
jgi:LPXTG-motif cell wall-anchored protein